jgi:hypothetical protein
MIGSKDDETLDSVSDKSNKLLNDAKGGQSDLFQPLYLSGIIWREAVHAMSN